MPLDTKRHDALFDKKSFTEDLHLIGTGSVGSALAYQLAKLGIGYASRFHVWDGDTVASHNIANQAYYPHDIGEKKAKALGMHIREWSDGTEAIIHSEFVTKRVPLSGVVILCLDNMEARRDICRDSLWNNPDVSLVIETRMDASLVIIHAFDPNLPLHIKIWESYWYPTKEMENEEGYGGPISIMPSITMAASLAAQLFIKYARDQRITDIPNQVRLNLRTWELKKAVWQ